MKAGRQTVRLYKRPVFWSGIAVLVGGAAVVAGLLVNPGGEGTVDVVGQTYSGEDLEGETAGNGREDWQETESDRIEAGNQSEQGEEPVGSDPENVTEEEEFMDPAVWKASLDQAITDAIRQAQVEPDVTSPDRQSGESHYILDIRDLNGQPVAEGACYEQDVIVYVVFQLADFAKPDYEKYLDWPYIGARRYVAAITFSVEKGEASHGESQEAEPLWTLKEFRWEISHMQDEETEDRLRELIPADLVEMALKVSRHQVYIDMLTSKILEQAVRDAELDGDRLVAEMFDIMFEATDDEDADIYIYLNKYFHQYVSLYWYGDYTIRYVCSALLRGECAELEQKVLAEDYFYRMVCCHDDFPHPYTFIGNGQSEVRGRGYFLEYLSVAQELADAHGMEWMRDNEPYKWKILVMVSEIRQELEQEQDGESAQE